jgi:outer membrane protein assembly factor BamB
MHLCLYVLLALGAPGPAAGADDWPQFRGPTGQGLVRGRLPLEWGPKKNVTWKKAIPGAGWSSPVVSEGRVYLTTAVPGRGRLSLRALCLDARSGKLLWDREVFRPDPSSAPRIHSKNSHASPTPVARRGRLYVHFGHLGTACLDADGKLLWANTSLKYSPVHGSGGSPVLVDDKLVFSVDARRRRSVVALDAKSGKVRWRTDRSGEADRNFSFSSPLVIPARGKKQIISPGSDMVGAYDPDTGKEVWKVRYSGYSVVCCPAFAHGLLFVSTGFDSPLLLAVRAGGRGDVTDTHVEWALRRHAPQTASPLAVGDELYVVSDAGTATCLDARSGKVHWQRRLGGGYSASPVHSAGRVYFQNEDGVATVVKAGKTFERLARNDLGERTLASYAASGAALFIRTEGHLYRIEER